MFYAAFLAADNTNTSEKSAHGHEMHAAVFDVLNSSVMFGVFPTMISLSSPAG